MTLTDFIEKAQENLMLVAPIKLQGSVEATCNFLAMMTNTIPEESMPEYWHIRLWLRRN